MKAGIYDPYLDTLGGGEKYTLTFADCLSKLGYQVDVFWGKKSIKRKIKERLNIKVERINFTPKNFKSSGYDLIFFLSDGSIPFLSSKQNILHFQVPFHDVHGRSLLNRIKMMRISDVVCNSFFTKRFIDREYGVKSKVLYPPVAVESFKPLKKENLIINVGRFTTLLHNKRQDILIEAFKKLKFKDWRLLLVGGDEEGQKLVLKLKQMAKGYPIEIITNPRFDYLKQLYGRAKIFWTAAGFGFDEEKEPEKSEHFGITTCFVSGTRIETEIGVKKIESINIGEKVLTHKGRYQKVSGLKKRKYHGEMVKITPSLFNREVVLTPDHRLYVIKTGKCVKQNNMTICKPNCAKQSYRDKRTGYSMGCDSQLYRDYEKKWVPVEGLSRGDCLVFPIFKETSDKKFINLNNYVKGVKRMGGRIFYTAGHSPKTRHEIPEKILIDKDFMRLAGYYVAEGCTTASKNAVSFSFHTKEQDYIRDVQNLMLVKFNLRGGIRSGQERGSGVELTFSSKIVANLMSSLFNQGARNKHLPSWAMKLSLEKQRELLKGLWRGDGNFFKQGVEYTTSSIVLANQIKMILLRFGIVCSIIKSRDVYMLRTYSIGLEKMLNILAEKHNFLTTRSKTYQHYWVDDDYVYLPIAKIKRTKRNCWVYNLEVKEDRSYVTECLTAHNCEAMSAGCVPVVIKKGGQPEIVSEAKNGLLWTSEEELIAKTLRIINHQPEWRKLSAAAQKKANNFSEKRFCQEWRRLIK